MIQRTSEGLQIPPATANPLSPSSDRREDTWQQILSSARRTPDELARLLGLDASWVSAQAHADFPLVVPDPYLARIRREDPTDPLLLQVLPVARELDLLPGFTRDPLSEVGCGPAPGMIRRFRGRALITAASTCGINCRYCFRRHFPYREQTPTYDGWQHLLDEIAGDPALKEVILSGGDPLVLNDRTLSRILDSLAAIPHVSRIRIHTRMPIVIPQRVTDELVEHIARCTRPVVVVVHCNHPHELDAPVHDALTRLRRVAVLFNQSVLLKGVNDSAGILCELSETLFAMGVVPYYLHMLDRVQGAAHFEVTTADARKLQRELSRTLPGYLVPRFVRDLPNSEAKRAIDTWPVEAPSV